MTSTMAPRTATGNAIWLLLAVGVVVVASLCRTISCAAVAVAAAAVSSSLQQCQTATIFGLKTADCHGLGLDEIPRGLDRDTKVLKFAENRLSSLAADQFRSYPTLQEIYLVRNRITTIAAGAFRGLLSLQKIDLEANQLSAIRYEFLADARSVRVLNFRYNPIVELEPGALSNLVNLEEISLERCRLTSLDARTFEGLDRLVEINLADNDLVGLAPEMERHLPVGLRVFRFYRNPWRCDCHLRWLRVWTASRTGNGGPDVGGGVNWDFARNTPTCAGPRLLRGVSWKLLDADQFACPAQIIVNSSTSIRVTPGSNASVECAVAGDPEPTVTWYKDSIEIDGDMIEVRRNEHQLSQQSSSDLASVVAKTRVIVLLNDVTAHQTGDYRCVAQNSAGRSEVTFKVWMDHGSGGGSGSGSRHRLQHQELEYNAGAGTPGIPVEVAIGAAVGTGLVVVAMTVFTAIVCVIRRRRHFRHHSYYVRDYHQTPAMSNNNSSAGKSAKKNASSNSINGGRASKKRSSAAKNRTQIGFSRHGGSGGGAVGDHGLRRNTIGSSRLPACLRASHDAEVSAADDDDDDGDKDDVDGATEVRGRYGYGLRQDSSDMEKFVSTTLQSLLEDKDATVAPTSIGERQDGDVVKSNEIHHHLADELQLKDIVDNGRINDAADAEALGVDDDCSSALNRIGNRSPRHLATDAALSELADDQSECFETKKEAMVAAAEPPVAVSEADGKQNPTPDLLQDGGCGGDQLRSLFRRGGSTARSPCRRTSSRSSSSSTTGAKVSFAIDCYKDDKESNDDETSAILIPASAAGTRGSSLSGFAAARYRAEENQYVKRIPGLETINTCGPSSFGYGHGRPTVNAIPLTPTSSCSTAAAMLLDTPESSNSGCSGYCVARTGSLGRRVRPSATTTSFDGSCTADVAARHMTLPGSYCSYAATSSSSGGGNSRGSRSATSATGSSSKPPLPLIAQLEKTFTIALPSTIVGVTEGLFMPPSSHCQLAQMATSSGSSTLPPPAPRKPSRAYEWQATAAGGCSASGVSAVSDAVGDLTSTGQINATTVPSSFKPTTKRVQLQPPPPSSSASSSSSASTQPRKNSFGTAV